MKVKCNECGKVFKVSPKNADPECPQCGSVDLDVADISDVFFGATRNPKRKSATRNYSTGPFDFAEAF
jgi:predicted  nucleic acid-binding Zn-ribbon protein